MGPGNRFFNHISIGEMGVGEHLPNLLFYKVRHHPFEAFLKGDLGELHLSFRFDETAHLWII